MSIVVKSVKLFSGKKYIPSEKIKVGEYIVDGIKHKLYTIPLGTTAKFRPVLNNNIELNNIELSKHLKWILCHIDPKNGTKSYKSWEGDKPPAFSYDEKEKLENYADTQIVSLRYTDKKQVGAFYWLESFMQYPEFPDAAIPKGVYVTFEDTAFIDYAYFSKKNYYETGDNIPKPITKYGEKINLFLKTYKLGDPTLNYHNYGEFKVQIFSKRTNSQVSSDLYFRQEIIKDPTSFIDYIRLPFLIEEDWRNIINQQPDVIEEYYAIILPLLRYNKRAKVISNNESQIDDNNEIKEIDLDYLKDNLKVRSEGKKEKVIIAKNKQKVLLTYNSISKTDYINYKEEEQNVEINSFYQIENYEKFFTKHFFKVIYNYQKEIIEDRNNKVSEQMAKIEDLNYNNKSSDLPCKYTKIEFFDSNRKSPLIPFEETEFGAIDGTSQSIDIISGDKLKPTEVAFKLHDLTIANDVECLKINGVHEKIEDVFRLNESQKFVQWIEEGDSEIVDGNTLKLKLQYVYNKSIEKNSKDWIKYLLGNEIAEMEDQMTDSILNSAWIFKYVFLKNIKPQNYFVPINTCRYPSQTIGINVYPDFRWRLKFQFISEKNTTERTSHFNKYGKEKVSHSYYCKKFTLGEKEYKFAIEPTYWYNGTKSTLSLVDVPFGDQIDLLIWMFKTARELTFSNEIDKSDKRDGDLIINVGVPTIEGVIEAAFKYSVNRTYKVGLQHKFGGALQWNISGELNLLLFAKFFGPAGAGIESINKIVKKIEYFSNGKLDIDYGIFLFSKVEINVKPNITVHSIDGVSGGIDLRVRVIVGLRIGLEAKAKLRNIKIYAGMNIGAEAHLKGVIAYNGSSGFETSGEFEGLFLKGDAVLGKTNDRGIKKELKFSVAETILGPKTFKKSVG
ncbi:hypothetical protein [Cellulophaga sp. HaHa_2_1]|uniref:hypothetical protein n=1 Tax=Cellulophaga sp. HaHa_2_1 TaxID=2749994 RepID=UPI001C4F17A4|nr:hypothetical protein [Cellulophaga sp. HaHa_2_1]QXP52957.1 hypothetical protein H0I24_03250 [Cellulophaga sp. HaHa_2_1]